MKTDPSKSASSSLFQKLRACYRSKSPRVRRKEQKKLQARLERERERRRHEERVAFVLETALKGDCTVRSGPFQGMNYLGFASGSQLLPKLLGSYEEPIHQWISKANIEKYRRVIDIGCAEGYYAVGFARGSNLEVLAYDLDPVARERCEKIARLNDVTQKVRIRAQCDFAELQRESSPDALIFCDIEGHEIELLNPQEVPALTRSDLIVEAHDFIIPSVTEKLVRRFSGSHRIEIVVDYPRNKEYWMAEAGSRIDSNYIDELLDERRPPMMRWLRLTHLRD